MKGLLTLIAVLAFTSLALSQDPLDQPAAMALFCGLSTGVGYELVVDYTQLSTDSAGATYPNPPIVVAADGATSDTKLVDTACDFVRDDTKCAGTECWLLKDVTYACTGFDIAIDGDGDNVATLLVTIPAPDAAGIDPVINGGGALYYSILCTEQDQTLAETINLAQTITLLAAGTKSKTKDKYIGTGGVFQAFLVDAGVVDTADPVACQDAAITSVTGPFTRGQTLSVFTRFEPAADTHFTTMSIIAVRAYVADTDGAGTRSLDYIMFIDRCPKAGAGGLQAPQDDAMGNVVQDATTKGFCKQMPFGAFDFKNYIGKLVNLDIDVLAATDHPDALTKTYRDCTGVTRRRRRAVNGGIDAQNITQHVTLELSFKVGQDGQLVQHGIRREPIGTSADNHQDGSQFCMSSAQTIGIGLLIVVILIVAAAVFIVGIVLMRRRRESTEKTTYVYDNGGCK